MVRLLSSSPFIPLLTLLFVSLFQVQQVFGFGVQEPVAKLLQQNAAKISQLKDETKSIIGNLDEKPYSNDVFYLRYCLDDVGVDKLKENLAWRQGPGKAICEAAVSAYAQATASSDKWNNEPVRAAAPYSQTINEFITPSTCLTTTSTKGDLIYCIRAAKINDKELMSKLDSVDNLIDFFLYAKEVNALVANDRSLESDKLVYVITANDLNNLQLVGGDATFRQALGGASKIANDLYPATNGPTLLLNLPKLLSALVKLFTPLFPPEVSARLKFERGPLANVEELLDVSYGGSKREEFLKQVETLCY